MIRLSDFCSFSVFDLLKSLHAFKHMALGSAGKLQISALMALAGLSEELTYKIRAAQPKPKPKVKRLNPYSQIQLDSEVTDQQLIARLASLAPLVHASTVACKCLQQLGEGFQRSTKSIGADAVFLRQLEDKDPPMAAASKGMIDAFSSFGELFLELSKQLRRDLLAPMEAIQNSLKEACMDERIQIKELEHQEALCSQAVQEIGRRKEKANAELQAAAKAEGRKGWFRASNASNARLEEIAAMQTAVVEELASKIDQEAAVRRSKEQSLRNFKTALRQLDKTCVSHLEKLSEDLSSMWIDLGQRVERIAATKGPSPVNQVLRPYLPPHRTADQASLSRGVATDMTTNRIELQEVSSEHISPKTAHTRESSQGSEGREGEAEKAEKAEEAEVDSHIYVAPAESLAPITAPETDEAKRGKSQISQTLQFGEHVRKLGFEVRGWYRHVEVDLSRVCG